MVLPGIQALFGFQLIAVFNQGFSEKLSPLQQKLHFFAILSTVVSIALVMAPAAIHRLVDPLSVSERFVRISTRLLLCSLIPLAVSICLELYLIGDLIMNSSVVGVVASVMALGLFLLLWVALPLMEQRRHNRR